VLAWFWGRERRSEVDSKVLDPESDFPEGSGRAEKWFGSPWKRLYWHLQLPF